MLDRLPIRSQHGGTNTCLVCNKLESMGHIFFDCSFARDIWHLFGISLTEHAYSFNIITGSIIGLKKDPNLFWHILFSYILWFIWKFRNEDSFQGNGRILTGFHRKLTHFKIILGLLCDVAREGEAKKISPQWPCD